MYTHAWKPIEFNYLLQKCIRKAIQFILGHEKYLRWINMSIS